MTNSRVFNNIKKFPKACRKFVYVHTTRVGTLVRVQLYTHMYIISKTSAKSFKIHIQNIFANIELPLQPTQQSVAIIEICVQTTWAFDSWKLCHSQLQGNIDTCAKLVQMCKQYMPLIMQHANTTRILQHKPLERIIQISHYVFGWSCHPRRSSTTTSWN